ncbi:MAG TPA: YqaJ viral recombinase family protein [Coriobacteriia bacterium]|nr:YqaJ viral recombinase family protein [Coriobacteriia bacterium]
MNPYTRITDFHGSRRRGVGASDIPTLAGLNVRYGDTPLSLWRVKTGRDAPWAGNDATWWGHVHEQAVLYRWVRDALGEEVAARFRVELATEIRPAYGLHVLTECWHPRYPFALAHADLVRDCGYEAGTQLVEAKSHSLHASMRGDDPDFGYSPDDHSANGLPAAVFLQVQWQLLCYDAPSVEVAALINTNDYRVYGPVTPDRKVQESSLALAERFWWHVEHDKPPQPATWEDVCSLFPIPRQTTAMVAGEQEQAAREMLERRRKLRAREAEIKAELDDLKNALGLMIGENAVLANAEGELLARSYGRSRETVDIAALRKLPDLHEAVVGAGLVKRAEWRELR